MRYIVAFAIAIWAGILPAQAAHTKVRLILAAEAAKPGDTVQAGIHLHMDPGWHTYWKNPGQSGLPTSIDWDLPPGISVGEIEWPLPKKVPEAELTTYVYEGDAVLLLPLKIAADAKSGTLTLKANLGWLECEKQCVRATGNVEATLTVGSETKASADKESLETSRKKLPATGEGLMARASWEDPAASEKRAAVIEWNSVQPADDVDFYPDKSDDFEVQPQTEKLPSAVGKIRLRIRVTKSAKEWPKEISGVLVQGAGDARKGYEVKLPCADAAPSAGTSGSAGSPKPAPADKPPLLKMLVYAFLGGLILNIMPCVLPVISLKILGFVKEARGELARVRKLGLIYTAGVLASFLALALIVVAFHVAWGFQFTNPYFLIGMATLITLVSLNLFGVFEVTLSSGALTAASALTSKEGAVGTFFNGFLATVLATSCSAAFFAPAIGYATTISEPLVTVLVLLTAGVGLAAPYLILSWHPEWLRFLPKPGPWMQRFKAAMGFPMLATTVWLCSLVAAHYGDRAWWMAVFLVFVATAAWIYGEFVQRGSKRRGVAAIVSILLLGTGYGFALESRLMWRQPIAAGETSAQAVAVAPKGLSWEKWSPAAVTAARAAGRPVAVDFTAKWCPNCNIIVKPSFEDSGVQAKLKELNVALFVADYTLSSKTLVDDLKPFGRAAIPVVLIYSAKSDQPEVFDFVTPTIIVDALERAVH
jgi:thiol:disulfide interchange protein DsbD